LIAITERMLAYVARGIYMKVERNNKQDLKIGANLKLSRSDDCNGLLGAIVPASLSVLNRSDNIHTLDNLAKDNVVIIQPIRLDGGNKEL
jgi:hypothetical protein